MVQTTPNTNCILFGVVCSGKKHTKNKQITTDSHLFLHGVPTADCRSKCDDSAILMMFIMIVGYLHIFMKKCNGDTKYHNSTLMIDNVCKIVLLSVLWTILCQ